MQVNVGLLLVGLCGAALFFMLLGVMFYERLHHFTRRFFFMGIINAVIGETKDEIESSVPEQERPHVRVSQTDLRAKAQSLDFDSAVAKYSGQEQDAGTFDAQSAPPRPAPLNPPAHQPSPLGRSLGNYEPPPSLRRRERRDREDGEAADEVLGMLDDDGE
jgi:hypothetical protein